MAQDDKLSQWANIARIAAAITGLISLVLGGGFFYREVWHVSDLRYTVLPTYDMEDMALSGLVVENRGRMPARDVDIVLAGLEHDIERLYMPGAHEMADTTWDPNNPIHGTTIEMERLSPGSSLPIYLLTSGPIILAEGETFPISSDRGKARPSSGSVAIPSVFLLVFLLEAAAIIFITYVAVRSFLLASGFREAAEVWFRNVQSISNELSKLKSDCEQGKVGSVQEAGGRVDTIGSGVYGLFTSIKDALNWEE